MLNPTLLASQDAHLRPDVCLKRMNSWMMGGRARWVFEPQSVNHLCQWMRSISTPYPAVWLGLGSNVLIDDQGIDAVVIAPRRGLKSITWLEDGCLAVDCGVTCAKLARLAADIGAPQGLFFSGIPGTLGGALAMNAGAFGGETWAVVESVEVIDKQGQLHHLAKSMFEIGYRRVQSPFAYFGFVRAHIRFHPEQSPGRDDSAGVLRHEIDRLLAKRSATQPIGTYNCGSVFKNPIGDYAARLIEQCGLKGLRRGQASISTLHANFILNDKNASSEDVVWLMAEVQRCVFTQFGVVLEPEVHTLDAAALTWIGRDC